MLKTFLAKELNLLLLWLLIGFFAGFVYSLELLGISDFGSLLVASRMRSLHISQMLYGFFPLVLSILPFALFDRDKILDTSIITNLKRYLIVWNIFLLFMSVTILFGNMRGLPFYDFAYWLNFILAFSGIFYIIAIFLALKNYKNDRPLWVNISLVVVITAPLLLVFLMNPSYGQVEKTLIGPHGDNTLGMSFALIPLYYLLIKLNSAKEFIPKRHILWIIPFAGYIISLIIRNFFHTLTYNEEWFFQYLTLLYIPLLYTWLKDSGVSFKTNPYLIISILAFIFVDIEGNILFIPQIRWPIHRNDLIIAHAHIAMGIGVAFMAMSILHHLLPKLFDKKVAILWTILIGFIGFVLSLSGLSEAGIIDVNIKYFWAARAFFGFLIICLVCFILFKNLNIRIDSKLKLYHLIGFASDAMGGILLILIGNLLFAQLGFKFTGSWEYVVFAFMIGTGTIHYFGLFEESETLANTSAIIRLLVASMFIALFTTKHIDGIGVLVGIYDAFFAFIYLLFLKDKK
jgi:cytochrome c oxidase cbb3-type subunit I